MALGETAADDGARLTAARTRHIVTILLVSLAGLLLEVGYTRIISFKLWYYYTYLVLGLALLGIGSGGIFVVVWPRLRQAATDTVVTICALAGAVSIAAGYLFIARLPIDTLQIWDYGTKASFKNLAVLGLVCFTLFASFIAIGIIVATLLGRATDRLGRFYFADLIGAGLGAALAVPLIWSLGPPEVVMLSALILVIAAVAIRPRSALALGAAAVIGVTLFLAVIDVVPLPDVRTEQGKGKPSSAPYSAWGPVFRVDAVKLFDSYLLFHDGTFGSGIHPYNGDPKSLKDFDTDPRAFPFAVMGTPPKHVLIIGSAGGNEILASLHFGAKRIEGVELNPVTLSLLTGPLRKFSGDLVNQPGVQIHRADGRSFLFRSDDKYDMVWYVAPDSYAATNAASSGAFVLSESYLYTTDIIEETLKHLTPNGMMVVQFGELDYEHAPNRTARYVMTARKALENMGVQDPSQHIIVSTKVTHSVGDHSTILVKKTPFTPAEVARYKREVPKIPQSGTAWAPGTSPAPGLVGTIASASTQAEANKAAATYPLSIGPVTDDQPFFWHFAPFNDVISNIFKPLKATDPEEFIGERVLLLLLVLAVAFAAVFLLAPFLFIRKEWKALPAKGVSGVYFAMLGLGFMFYEVTMIQRLVRFLGYPTFSLTVTLASILVFTGLGALLSKRWAGNPRRAVTIAGVALVLLTILYLVGLDELTDGLLDAPFAVRVFVAVLALAPLGLCLGTFMPLGLGVVAGLTPHPEEYVAWGWAVNGFFSVIGSVLTTILAMSFGFHAVTLGALGIYAIAVAAFIGLERTANRALATS